MSFGERLLVFRAGDPAPVRERCAAIDLRSLLRLATQTGTTGGWLGCRGAPKGEIGYSLDVRSAVGQLVIWSPKEGKYIEQEILLASTDCNYGGVRWWACCPRCFARRAVLYAAGPSTEPWCCRKCANVRYLSATQDESAKTALAVRSIKRRLGGSAFDQVYGSFPPRPPRFRWGRYLAMLKAANEALAEHDVAVEYRIAAIRTRGRRMATRPARWTG